MGIEGSGTPGGMLRRMSFIDQDARRTRPGGQFLASITPYQSRAMSVQGSDRVFEP